MKASDLDTTLKVIPTGFPGVDSLIGGGLPQGKILEIAGSWSVGKSTLAYQMISVAQKQGRPCLLIDAERAYTQLYGSSVGVDNLQLEIFRARTAEEYLDQIIEWCEVKKNKGGVIVIDAIGALLPKEELEKTAEAKTIGVQARLLGAFARKIIPLIDDAQIALVALNHTFIPLGQMGIASSGGAKWAYARSVWFVLSRKYGAPAKRDAEGKKTLISMTLEVKKNKVVSNEGTKIDLELISGAGFVGETVVAPEPKKRGRPAKVV